MSEPRLVDVSTARVAPDHVVRELRTIDPRAELLYVQRGKWWLGMVYTDIPLIGFGRSQLCHIKDEGGASWATLRLAQLKAQGFRRVILPRERWPRDPLWGFVVSWFRKQDWAFRHIPNSDSGWEREYQRHEQVMTGEDQIDVVKQRLVDFVNADRHSLMRRIQRGVQMGYLGRQAVNQ